MRCHQIFKYLPAYIHGELTTESMARIANHLQHCPACRVECARLGKATEHLKHALQTGERDVPNPLLWQQIEERILSEQRESVSRISHRPGAAGQWNWRMIPARAMARLAFAAALVLLLFTVLWIANHQRPWNFASQSDVAERATLSRMAIVESVEKPNVTVMTFHTEDPHVKIIWFFDPNLKID